jgi:hypothetical protein
MSLLSAESAAALLSVFAVQAAAKSANDKASDALNRGIYCTMKLLLRYECLGFKPSSRIK